jgi:DNA-binding CsgD family transcriptional regulator
VTTLVRRDAEVSSSRPNFPNLLAQRLADYSRDVADANCPEEVLDRLHAITSTTINLNVGGAGRFPQRVMDWNTLKLGKTVFLGSNIDKRFWQEWIKQVPHKLPAGLALVWASQRSLTATEVLQIVQPVGVDRWGFDLALKWGIRDTLVCPVDDRWLLYFWSAKPIAKSVWKPIKVLLFAASNFAAMRLDELVVPEPASDGRGYRLTPRELAVLRQLSLGTPFKESAHNLGLGTETVRTHLRKAQAKLGVRNRAHAIAEAIRHRFIL